jgi:hypothetical protein
VTGGKPIAVCSQLISGLSAVNPSVAFYEIHGRKRKVLFFYLVPDITRDLYVYDMYNLEEKYIIVSALYPC